jgi:iron(III) transport system substrate-binding protein
MRAVGLCLCFLLCGCGPRKETDLSRLVVYSAGPRPLAVGVCEQFTRETGIEVELFQATTGQLMAKLEAEKHRPRADVVLFASEVAAAALKAQDRLRAHSPADPEGLRAEWSDPDGYYHATAAALVGVAVSTEVDSLPATWEALLTEPGSLRMTMPSPSRSGAAGDFTVGYFIEVEDALEQFQTARRNGLDFASANSQAIGSLLMGAHQVIVGAADYLIYRQIERGEPLRMVFPEEGAVLVTRPIAILASARNPEGAKRFVDFYLGGASQRMVSDALLLPAREGVALHPVRDPVIPRLIRADPDEAVRRQTAILRDFQMRVERAVLSEAAP